MSMSQEEIEALMGGVGEITPDEEIEDSIETEETEPEDIDIGNMDDILASIEGIVDNENDNSSDSQEDKNDTESLVDVESLIDENQYPLPAKSENKVVNQLNEVADDSEEKASQIFDVLSFILDENNEIEKYNKSMGEFIEKQANLLESLTAKFPKVELFNENLSLANELIETSKSLSEKVNGENNKVFEAMELMQYHDINRQKIERVMAVIKKLNQYLNGIFEDDSDKPDVQIAKHISGDSNEIVDADDLESLISEFSNEG